MRVLRQTNHRNACADCIENCQSQNDRKIGMSQTVKIIGSRTYKYTSPTRSCSCAICSCQRWSTNRTPDQRAVPAELPFRANSISSKERKNLLDFDYHIHQRRLQQIPATLYWLIGGMQGDHLFPGKDIHSQHVAFPPGRCAKCH